MFERDLDYESYGPVPCPGCGALFADWHDNELCEVCRRDPGLDGSE